ncbi:hypothetical protein HYH03_017914 [Edaphochlamys debaryana]|uniref:Uncharacterized protein n=1 Tax=Edaphochlamys debaryana TaxID=47281 RepID=A0A835XJ29_9CHLO|nr:hypothetical protein HYH03_017914 [Edaphochlamys debaryana]|eukprot:KAG2483216.1 hypothetical protein HYH03_017914 [Edaphochlamys debaryana]
MIRSTYIHLALQRKLLPFILACIACYVVRTAWRFEREAWRCQHQEASEQSRFSDNPAEAPSHGTGALIIAATADGLAAFLRTRRNLTAVCGGNSHRFLVSDGCVEDRATGRRGDRATDGCGAVGPSNGTDGAWSALRRAKILVAVELQEEGVLSPTFAHEFLKVVVTLQVAFNATVYVTLLGAATDLPALRLAQLGIALANLGVRHEVVTRGVTRDPQEHRTALLARVRNLSIKQLLVGRQEYETALFFNDVYFCAQSALDVLLLRAAGADMVCSADFSHNEKREPVFYDIWATRDLQGRKFQNGQPYVGLPDSWQRFQAGLPVPVYSCWGGMAAVTAAAFTEHRLRFRRNYPTECAASESEILCRDMWAVNLTKIFLLPTAISAYSHNVFVAIQQPAVSSRPSHPDLSATDQPPPQRPISVECCPLEDSCESSVDFSGCIDDNVTWFYRLYGVPVSAGGMQPAVLTAKLDPATATMRDVSRGLQPAQCPTAVQRRIPRRIVQTWKTNKPTAVRQHVWFLVLSWILQNPCYEYDLVTDAEIETAIKKHPLYSLWRDIPVRGMKNDFGRYLYLNQVGGIYADIDTISVRPFDSLIRPEDEFVVGLEAAFAKWDDALAWAYAVQKSASLHCWATSPGSKVLGVIIEEVARRLKNPVAAYKAILKYGRGSPVFLETLFTTGPAAFSAAIFDLVPTKNLTHGLRQLDLHALSGGHSQGDRFYNLQDPKYVQDKTVYVEHRNYGSWVPKRHLDKLSAGSTSVLVNRPLVTGEWFYSSEPTSAGPPNDASSYVTPGQLFAWLTPPLEGRSCLRVMSGLGPRDPNSKTLQEVCWNGSEEEDVTWLWLEMDGNLRVYTAKRSWCACEPAGQRRQLWAGAAMQRGFMEAIGKGSASALVLSKAGVLNVLSSRKKPEVDPLAFCFVARVAGERCDVIEPWERTLLRLRFC